MGNRIGWSGHVRRTIPVLSDTGKQLIAEDTTHDADQDDQRQDFERYVEDVYSGQTLIDRLADGLRHVDKATILGLLEEYAPGHFKDIEDGWKDSLT